MVDTYNGYTGGIHGSAGTMYGHIGRHSAVERVMNYAHSNIHEPQNNYTETRQVFLLDKHILLGNSEDDLRKIYKSV